MASTAGCTSAGDAHAWTFVELDVQDVLLGSLIPAAGQAANRFTVRLKGGVHPDGAHSGLLGTPQLVAGDEVVLILRYGVDGEPVLAPVPSGGDAVYRVLALADGSTAVVDGRGMLLVDGPLGKPLPGPRIPAAVSNWPLARPIDRVAAQSEIDAYRAAVAWTGDGVPEGPWQGSVRVDIDQVITVTVAGVGTQTVDLDTTCVARMHGETAGNTLSLSGRCNVDYVGALHVELSGTYAASHWSGTVGLAPSATTGIGAMVTFQEQPWSALDSTEDYLVANGTGTNYIGDLPPDVTVTSSEPLHAGVDLRALWTGFRPVMDRAALLAWLADEVAASGAPGGTARSQLLGTAACNPVVAVVGGAP